MRFAIVAVALLALAGCSDDDPDDGSATTVADGDAATVAPATTAPPATEPAPVATTAPGDTTAAPATTAPEPVVGEPVVAAELVVELDQPIGMAVRPGDDHWYVIEQHGLVLRIAPDTEPVVVADLTDRTSADGERGLLGIAFSGDGSRVWLNYTDGNGDTVVAEYPVAADGAIDVAAERVLLNLDQPYANHNGGELALGPDGMLYVAMGDGGAGGDPERRASDPTNLLGSLLRIDPTPSADAPYSVPADNPFASGQMGDLAGAPEVWAWGLRNPWKIAFDPANGNLWIADVGQGSIEEINLVSATAEHPAAWGANFGWSAFEGDARFNDDVADPGNLVFPVHTYGHDDGCSVSGGAVYRGTAIAELAPAFVYSDYCSGTVWAFDAVGNRNLVLVEDVGSVTAVRTGPDGELYVLDHSGAMYRLVPG